jgi:hypothetical protein
MQIALDIPDQLAAEAKAHGVPVEQYVRGLLEKIAVPPAGVPERSPAEIEAFFASMAEGSERLPALPTDTFTRESFYKP